MIDQLLALPEDARLEFLAQHIAQFDDIAANALKAKADDYLRSELHTALALAHLLQQAGEMGHNPFHRALGLRAEANCYAIGLGQFEQALTAYDAAAAIYRRAERPLDEARAQVGKIWSLTALGRFAEATQLGEWIAGIFEQHGEWVALADLTVNMGLIDARQNNDLQALDWFDQAYQRYAELDAPERFMVQLNRAEVLRNLGRFDESVRAGWVAYEQLTAQGQLLDAARAQQTIALTYLLQGRLNDALALLAESRQTFQDERLDEDIATAELQMSDALLQLQRYPEAIERASTARERFVQFGARHEQAQCWLNQASGHIGLKQNVQAINALQQASQLFAEEGNLIGQHSSQLEMAALLCRDQRYAEALHLAEAAHQLFAKQQQPLKMGWADLRMAEATAGLNQPAATQQHLLDALQIGRAQQAPALAFSAHAALGDEWMRRQSPTAALTEYDAALALLEQLRGSLMIEHRAGFVADKQRVYAVAVQASLQLHQVERAFGLVERAKSRSLLDLLAHKVNLGVHARSVDDMGLVEEIQRLQSERRILINQIESQAQRERNSATDQQHATQATLHQIERDITEQWHALLIKNADYARDAALWEVNNEPMPQDLAADIAILEYFAIGSDLVLFVVTKNRIEHMLLLDGLTKAQTLLRNLQLNMRSVPGSPSTHWPQLTQNAKRLLLSLQQLLVAPVLKHLRKAKRLVIVPHGPLHFLPFHALHDGQHYLIEQFEVSYLPSASLLTHQPSQPSGRSFVAFGHSRQGQLPSTVSEAQQLAALMNGQALVEGQATLAVFGEQAGAYDIVHIAAHGEFRADAPLFSGIFLEDGALTTLDVFNLQLNASLVTLSACETGRNVISGGDELLGLMRAFLSAGAQSLLMSLWRVEDQSTQRLMMQFYEQLRQGQPHPAALRIAQCALLGEGLHPYFWAAFELVGGLNIPEMPLLQR